MAPSYQGTTLPWNISTFLRKSYVNPTYLYGVIGNADSLLIATVPYDTVRSIRVETTVNYCTMRYFLSLFPISSCRWMISYFRHND
jgi:hypothetical protein